MHKTKFKSGARFVNLLIVDSRAEGGGGRARNYIYLKVRIYHNMIIEKLALRFLFLHCMCNIVIVITVFVLLFSILKFQH